MKFTKDQITKALNRKRFHWIDGVMREELPTEIYGGMHSISNEDRARAAGWLNERGYRINDAGDGVIQIFRGTALVRQTKLVLELDDPEELLAIAEVVEHKNIPPPPWNPNPNA